MIELKNVDKSYGAQRVLTGFSLTLPEGSKTALMGLSGAGKTTVLRLIMGLIKPDGGVVAVPKNTRFGAVFQEDRLIEQLSAPANCGLVLHKGGNDPQIILRRLGLGDELLKKPVSELSGGERRRVAIARALLSEPDVLILDEPFKGIDEKTLPSVIEAVAEAAEGKILLLVTHSIEEAHALGCGVVEI